jgi:uronate dehydrogenase
MAIVITGAAGNLGRKITRHLSARGCDLVLFDQRGDPEDGILETDLSTYDAGWAHHMQNAEAVIHLAGAAWPFRDWVALQRGNIDAIVNVLRASIAGRVRRFVFASSLLTMEGYRDGEGQIRPDMPARPMSFYAVTKLMGERLTYAASQRDGLDVICLRLGIARPGANLPSKRVGLWEQQKWLGNTDACRAIESAVFHPHQGWTVVFATSYNAGMRWSLAESRTAIGYEPTESSTPVMPPLRSRTIGSLKTQLRRICARMSGAAEQSHSF